MARKPASTSWPGFILPGGNTDQVSGAKVLQKAHCLLGALGDLRVLGWVMHRAAKRDGDHVEIPLRQLAFELGGGEVVGLQNAWKAGEPDADESGVVHHVQHVRDRGQRIMRPQTGAERPFDIPVGAQAFGSRGQCGGERNEESTSLHRRPPGAHSRVAYHYIQL
jgi:hypothetical protein